MGQKQARTRPCPDCRGSGEDESQENGECRFCDGKGWVFSGRLRIITPPIPRQKEK